MPEYDKGYMIGGFIEKMMETGIRYSYKICKSVSFDIGYSIGRRFSAMNSAGRSEYTFNKIDGGVNINFYPSPKLGPNSA